MIEQAARTIDGVISRLVQGATAAPLNIAGELDRFHGAREKTLTILGEVTPAQALWSPAAGTWSIAQIADHLLRFDELYTAQFRRLLAMANAGTGTSVYLSLREVDTSLPFIPNEVLPLLEVPMRVFSFFTPSAVREAIVRYSLVPARSPKISDPRPGLTSEKPARGSGSLSMAETQKLLSGPLPANVDKLTIGHPVLGTNTMTQMLRILTAHEERHQDQMGRIRSNLKFPKA